MILSNVRIQKAIDDGDIEISPEPSRVLTQEGFLTAIGRSAKAKGGTGSQGLAFELVDGMPPFLVADNLKPFIDNKLRESTTPIVFRMPTGQRAFGYDIMAK